jgi:hypothetical protein
MTRSRCGNAVGVNGRASAAASETAPRMPAHDTTKTERGGGYGSRARIRALSLRGR